MTNLTSSTNSSLSQGVSRDHEGERIVQRRAGEQRPGRGSPMFDGELHSAFTEVIAAQPMVILGSPDSRGMLWASILTAEAGLAQAEKNTIVFSALPVPGDPLVGAFDSERPCATLFLDVESRRRVRVNGPMVRDGDRLVLHSDLAFRNCPKYIHRRELIAAAPAAEPRVTSGSELTAAQQQWISDSDTFFIASYSPQHGADVNHRGGPAGFVSVADARRISWPDYPGNSFYMTFGNLELNPACGLCFLDWEHGRTLHLSGAASIDWGPDPHDHTARLVHFEIDRVIEIRNATNLRWQSVDCLDPNTPPQEGKQ
ncbi:pyridoxamine 5'-phosphate oxidase family protein [Nocardia yamanashiensis]|uniref:pyridoxamine 5'-phosphate oxidase family protein n=1 Tax=Nocardia yamanashiensis TaxID=209247 RepID=UPI000834F89F|nr:pyridoxamine 5'-phosphate oxidase family protein [Nocardia yamanashiensis]